MMAEQIYWIRRRRICLSCRQKKLLLFSVMAAKQFYCIRRPRIISVMEADKISFYYFGHGGRKMLLYKAAADYFCHGGGQNWRRIMCSRRQMKGGGR
jgi:hypothetical protein